MIFDLANKRVKNRMDFFEWVKTFLEFGLGDDTYFNQFIFRMIDKDNKEMISIKDIYHFLMSKR